MRPILTLLIVAALSISAQAQDTLSVTDSIKVQLHGSVLDEITQQPLFEVLVEWYNSAGKRQAVTQTNDDGRYALFVWAGEVVEIRVSENGYEDYRATLPPFKASESAREHVIRLVGK